MLVGDRLTQGAHRHEDDPEWRALVVRLELDLADLHHLHSELFEQLATQRIGITLARLAFAAREFPEPAVPLVERALADEEILAAAQHGSDDAHQVTGRLRLVRWLSHEGR